MCQAPVEAGYLRHRGDEANSRRAAGFTAILGINRCPEARRVRRDKNQESHLCDHCYYKLLRYVLTM
jgi:hypothetical protein